MKALRRFWIAHASLTIGTPISIAKQTNYKWDMGRLLLSFLILTKSSWENIALRNLTKPSIIKINIKGGKQYPWWITHMGEKVPNVEPLTRMEKKELDTK